MTEKVFTKEAWLEALKGLRESYKIFVPVRDGDFHRFKPLEDEKTPDFDYQNSRLSPKALVYPQSERMFEYTLDESKPDAHVVKEVEKDYAARAIVGVRPCDAHGFEIVKLNFENPEYRDPWWVKRYECTTLVGLGCNEPCTSCFCTSVGGGPFSERALDVLLYDLGDRFLVKTITDQGEVFVEKAAGGSPPASPEYSRWRAGPPDEETLKAAEELAKTSSEKITQRVPTDKLRGKVITALFDAPFWDDVSFSCINCGTCTYLCPTCWCFDIQDEVLGKQGDRIRNWDSCMFPLFTLHGSGHNPREKKMQRVRQRFMHKLKYYVDRYEDRVQCSGCGRCVRYCPVNIDIRQICELMNEY